MLTKFVTVYHDGEGVVEGQGGLDGALRRVEGRA
jgi:hypothetical protein